MTVTETPAQDGVIYVTKEEFKNYIYSPRREKLMALSGMSEIEIQDHQAEMMSGRREVTYKGHIVKIKE